MLNCGKLATGFISSIRVGLTTISERSRWSNRRMTNSRNELVSTHSAEPRRGHMVGSCLRLASDIVDTYVARTPCKYRAFIQRSQMENHLVRLGNSMHRHTLLNPHNNLCLGNCQLAMSAYGWVCNPSWCVEFGASRNEVI
jgi:hypothetical protein